MTSWELSRKWLSFSPDAGARWVSSRYGIAYAEFRSSGLENKKSGRNKKEEWVAAMEA